MCGRYATFGPASLSRQGRDVLERLELDLTSEINQRDDRFNIAPTQRALIVTAGDRRADSGLARWGLIPSWARDASIGAKTINARREGLAENLRSVRRSDGVAASYPRPVTTNGPAKKAASSRISSRPPTEACFCSRGYGKSGEDRMTSRYAASPS